jgi:hypothetical protein
VKQQLTACRKVPDTAVCRTDCKKSVTGPSWLRRRSGKRQRERPWRCEAIVKGLQDCLQEGGLLAGSCLQEHAGLGSCGLKGSPAKQAALGQEMCHVP